MENRVQNPLLSSHDDWKHGFGGDGKTCLPNIKVVFASKYVHLWGPHYIEIHLIIWVMKDKLEVVSVTCTGMRSSSKLWIMYHHVSLSLLWLLPSNAAMC